MKFVVDMEDFDIDDHNVIDSLKEYIINDIVYQIKKENDKKIQEEIVEQVSKKIKEHIIPLIEEKTYDVYKNKKIKIKGRDISIEEYIEGIYSHYSNWNNPTDIIRKLVKELGDKLKERYDLLFATQLISKINELGYLKEDAAKALLSDKCEEN